MTRLIMLWRNFLCLYFGPWPLEMWRHGRIYELVGIRLWKAFLRDSGRPKARWKKLATSASRRTIIIHSLKQHRKFTNEYEVRHLIGAVIMQASAPLVIAAQNGGSMIVVTLLNLLINGFPIMLQRYNRVRIQVAIIRLES